MKSKSIISLIGGSILQWYDFALMGTLAPIIAKTFFPSADTTASLLYAFATFAVSFLLAPIGAIIFGHIGDKIGRKRVLTLTIILMTIPTALIAILPSYHQIGISAAIILVILRLAQGLTASPEFSAASIFMVESSPEHRQAFYGSLSTLGYTFGMILGGFITWQILSHFTDIRWAWRIPFVLSILGGLIVFVLRLYLFEPLPNRTTVKMPLLHAIQHSKRACLIATGAAWCQGVLAYGIFVWGITYIHIFLHLSLGTAILASTLSLLANAVLQPFCGLMADHIGKRKHLMVGLITLLILIIPVFYFIQTGTAQNILWGMLLLGTLMAFGLAPMNALAILQFRPEHRMSGFGTFFNISMAIFGGTAPLVLTALTNHSNFYLLSYFGLSILVGLACALSIKKGHNNNPIYQQTPKH